MPDRTVPRRDLEVEFVPPFEMLRRERARFLLA
jgi:hypothetical protein